MLTFLTAVGATVFVLTAISAHLTSFPEAGAWPVDFRPTLAELGVMTSGSYWAEGYLPTIEEISARISPLSEFASLGGPVKFGRMSGDSSPLFGFTPPGGSVECGACHLPMREMYPSGDPLAAWHTYQETHSDECDCISCHIPPHPVAGDCSCCSCHGCWSNGWVVESHYELGRCDICHEAR